MPTRILRDGIIDSRAVNALSEPGEILYRRLMSIVDDYGRFEADPELIRARCFPRQLDRWTIQRITDVLPELTVIHGDLRLVTVYAVESKKYLQINNFGQRVQCKEKYPSPDSRESTVIHGDSPSSRSRSRSRSSVVEDVETPKSPSPKKRAKVASVPFTMEEASPDMVAYAVEVYRWDWFLIHQEFEKLRRWALRKEEQRPGWQRTWEVWVDKYAKENPQAMTQESMYPNTRTSPDGYTEYQSKNGEWKR